MLRTALPFRRTLLSTACLFGTFCASSYAGELLLNGTFEGPTVAAGMNNIGTVPTSWTVENLAGTSTPGYSNLVRGAQTGSGNTSLPIYPGDTTGGDAQSLDGDNTGTAGAAVLVVQSFSLATGSPLVVKVAFGGRDSNSSTGGGSSWQLFNSANTVVAQSTTINPAPGTWTTSTSNPTSTLAAGTYRFVITLGDPDQLDGASITNVPEPSALAAVALGALALVGFGVRRLRGVRAA